MAAPEYDDASIAYDSADWAYDGLCIPSILYDDPIAYDSPLAEYDGCDLTQPVPPEPPSTASTPGSSYFQSSTGPGYLPDEIIARDEDVLILI